MDCRKVEDQNIIERYFSERLSEKDAEAFEQHYLECKRCFDELRMRHAAAIELSRRPIPVPSAEIGWTSSSWRWAVISAAAMLIIAVAGVLYLRSRNDVQPERQVATVQQPSPALVDQLASLDQIPPYIPAQIRGGDTNAALIKFQEGMLMYSDQKYAEAVTPLSEAARLDPELVPASFYLGIASLVSGNADGAIAQLSKVVSTENAYSEEGHWFLSKAYLRKRDFGSARSELQKVQSAQGAHSSAAQDLLRQIQNF